MKTKSKIIKLMEYGLSPKTILGLSNNQLDLLYNKLSEQVTPLPAKQSYKIGEKGGTLPPADKGYEIKKNPTDNSVTAVPMEEKFESKKQQKYFYSKCGEGKTKEEKKWCKMAKEFSDKTNFKKLPEKKKSDTNEGYLDIIGNSMSKNMTNKISDINPSLKWENELESEITKLLEDKMNPKITKRDFLKLIYESGIQTAQTKPITKPVPTTDPDIDFDPFNDPDPSDQPEASDTETAPTKPVTKPTPTINPDIDYDPFNDPDPSDQPEAKSSGLSFFMKQVKNIGMLK